MFGGCRHIVPTKFNDALADLRRVEAGAGTYNAYPLSELLGDSAAELEGETLWKIIYSYGDLVINRGAFALPGTDEGCRACRELQEHYSKLRTVPLLLNLSKNLEVFLICTDIHASTKSDKPDVRARRTVPVSHRRSGELIGLFETLRPLAGADPRYGDFYVSAGSRNIHLVLPLQDESHVIESMRGQAQHADPLEGVQAKDREQYGLKPTKSSRVASDWRLIKMAPHSARWKADLLLLPPKIIEVLDEGRRTQFRNNEWTRKLVLNLLLEGWQQVQDALESFVAEDEPHLRGAPYFLNIDPVSAPMVLRYLTDCVDGKALLHCPTREKDDNGPFPEFLRWASTITDYEQELYVPFVLEPRRLDVKVPGDFGLVSMIHPLIPKSLRFKEREPGKWGEKKLTADLRSELITRGMASLIDIYATDDEEDIRNLGFERIFEFLEEQRVRAKGKKVARNRCLQIFMKINQRNDPKLHRTAVDEGAS